MQLLLVHLLLELMNFVGFHLQLVLEVAQVIVLVVKFVLELLLFNHVLGINLDQVVLVFKFLFELIQFGL